MKTRKHIIITFAGSFTKDFAPVILDNKFYYINKKGNMVYAGEQPPAIYRCIY